MKNKTLWNVIRIFSSLAVVSIVFWISFITAFSFLFWNQDLYATLTIVIAVLVDILVVGLIWGAIKKKAFTIPVIVAIVLCFSLGIGNSIYEKHIESIPTIGESDNIYLDYIPYGHDTKVATLDEESTLKITENLPRMDGATALYPVYSAFARATYPKDLIENGHEYVDCSTTTKAYEKIVIGEADIIFAAAPSKEQMQFAKDNGVELVFTPIGREAFVFFVNAKNPMENITFEDVVKIYSGEITTWEELGVNGLGEIKAFQRDEGSGSQSTLIKLMGETPLMTPPKEDVVDGMGGIIENVSDYKNFKNAIGYSFRFYSSEMIKNDQIKYLSVNGVYPNIENIENETYPLASYFYAVTRSDADENTLKLLEWIQGEQGQKLIEMTGYPAMEK